MRAIDQCDGQIRLSLTVGPREHPAPVSAASIGVRKDSEPNFLEPILASPRTFERIEQDILLFQAEARVRSQSSRRYSSTKTSPTLSPPRRPSASITRFDQRSTCAFSRGRVERMSFKASRSLLPSGQGKSVRFRPEVIH